MSRLFIIGAGFSKAIADAPLANGLVKAIYKKSFQDEKNYINSGDWPNDRNCFLKLLRYFHESVQVIIKRFEENDRHKILNKDFEAFLESLNIEFLCSFIDLHLQHFFIPKVKDISMSGFSYIPDFHKFELEAALKFINHHMLDLLLTDNLNIKHSAFNKMSEIFKEGDNFISFNYDLVIEQMLWKRKLWNPFDGYGFHFDKNGNKNVHDSKTSVIKIHGSINWRSPDILFHPNLELAIDHPFKDVPLFDGLIIPKPTYDKIKYRQYPLYSYVIMPTFRKSPQYNWEISLITKSIELCKNSDEIYILGYSVPDADYITNLLFTEMNKKAKIYIVLWDGNSYPNSALALRNKLVKKYGFNKKSITHEHSKIEEWIDNDFFYNEYEEYLEDQKFMNEMSKATRKH